MLARAPSAYGERARRSAKQVAGYNRRCRA